MTLRYFKDIRKALPASLYDVKRYWDRNVFSEQNNSQETGRITNGASTHTRTAQETNGFPSILDRSHHIQSLWLRVERRWLVTFAANVTTQPIDHNNIIAQFLAAIALVAKNRHLINILMASKDILYEVSSDILWLPGSLKLNLP